MTRTFAITAVLAALAASATGCGGDEEPTTAAPPAETTTEPETTTESDKGDKEDEFTVDAKPAQSPAGVPGDDPETVLELFFTSGDPDLVCGGLATEELLSAAYGDEKGCRQAQIPAAVPDAIEIEEVDVSGDRAKATVIPDGGPNDGIETEVGLVKVDGGWLVEFLEADIPAGP